MKFYYLGLVALLCLLPFVSADVLVNMTFDTSDGFYNTSHAENLGVGPDFRVRGADYNLSYRDFDGYYTTGTSKYLNASDFKVTSEDGKHATHCFWVRGTSGFTGMALTNWDTNTDKRGISSEFDTDSRFKVLLSATGAGANKSYTSSIPLDDGAFHHACLVWNNGVLNIYIDGANDTAVNKTTDHAMTTIFDAQFQVALGARGLAGNLAGWINARFDNVLVYNTSLTPAQISSLYTRQSALYGAKVFHFADDGDDSSTTCSLEAPCRSITRRNELMTVSILAGDNISYECGSVWRLTNDTYMSYKTGASGAPITETSHCPADPNYATSVKNRFTTPMPYPMPRFLGSFNASNTSHWTQVSGNIWKSVRNYTDDIGNIVFNAGTINGQKKNYYENMSAQGDFFKKNITHSQLYMYSTSNPGTYYDDIELVNKSSIIYITSQDYITIERLSLWYGGTHGVVTTGNNVDIHFRNNDVFWMGGAYQGRTFEHLRLGNCQEFGLSGTNMSVINNRLIHCYDAGTSTQAWISGGDDRVIINHNYSWNLVAYASYGFEYFSSMPHSRTDNFVVDHNTFVYLGKNNFGTNSGRIRNDRTPVNTTDFKFTNNIVAHTDYRVMDFADMSDWYGDYESDHNLYFNSTGTNLIFFNGTNYPTLAAFQAAIPGYDVNSIESDPLFVDSAGLDFRLYSDSPGCTMSDSGGFVGAYSCYTEPSPQEPVTEFASGMNDTLGIVVSMFALIVVIVILSIVLALFAGGKIDGDQFVTLVIILMTTGILCGVGALLFSALGAF